MIVTVLGTGSQGNAIVVECDDDRVLIERFVPGRELAVSVLGSEAPWALPVVEPVLVDRDFYDFEARYTPGLTELHAPADLPDTVAEEAAQISLRCYEVLGCRGFARVDLFLENGSSEILVNEINTIPGFTTISMFPKLWQAQGISFSQLLDRLIAYGFDHFAARKENVDEGLGR